MTAGIADPAGRSGPGVLQLGMGWFTEEAGGLNRMYAGLYGALLAEGVRCRGLVAGNADRSGALPSGIHCFAPREAGLIQRWRACRHAVRPLLHDVEVVAAHFAPYALPTLDLLGGRPLVFHFHGPWAGESRAERQGGAVVFAKQLVESLVYRRAARFIVLSKAFAEVLAGDYGVARDRIHIVPGGVDTRRFAARPVRSECRARFSLPVDRPVVGAIRRLVHRVGIDMLLESMEGVRTRIPEALLVIAGTGPLAAALQARVAQRGLQQNVRFLGFVPDEDLPQFYGACDLTVVPSLALEGFGLTTIESLACGTPVLVTPVGGLPETVEALDPGLVVESATSDALQAGITRALLAPDRLPSRDACADHARRHFDWPVIAGRTLDVYRG